MMTTTDTGPTDTGMTPAELGRDEIVCEQIDNAIDVLAEKILARQSGYKITALSYAKRRLDRLVRGMQ